MATTNIILSIGTNVQCCKSCTKNCSRSIEGVQCYIGGPKNGGQALVISHGFFLHEFAQHIGTQIKLAKKMKKIKIS